MSQKVILLTGASSGIGRETALRLARQGHIVYGAARRLQLLEPLRAQGVRPLQLDVTDADSCRAAVQTVIQAEGHIDVLINNAGISGKTALIVETREGRPEYTPEDFEKVIATNLTGTFMFCQEAARQMIKQNATNGKKGGRIIITASVGGFIGGKGVVGYGASKAGCLSLARTMANNFGRENITVNCICPGYVVTPLNEEFFIDKDGNPTDYYKQQSKSTSVRRLGTIEEIAGPVLAMCSDSFSYMTGSYILADGGQSIPAE